MNQPASAPGTGIGQGTRMVVIATNDLGSLCHISTGRTNGRQVHDNRKLRNALHHRRIRKVRT